MTLADVFPQPTALDFGGRRLLCRPLRFRQLAQLQGWLESAAPSPAARCAAALASDDPPSGEALRRLLVGAYAEAETWPVAFGSAEGDARLDSGRGRLFFALVALGEANPDVPAGDLADSAARATAAEWAQLGRLAYRVDPLRSLAVMIERDAFAAAPRRDGPDWAVVVCEAVAETGWTFDQVAELTPGQLAAWRARGRIDREAFDVPPRPGESAAEACARRGRYFDLDGGPLDGQL